MFGKIREAFNLEKWVENFEGYLDARIELAKYDAREAAVKILTKGLFFAALFLFGLCSLLCLNFGLGYWLSSVLGNTFGGFFILAGFYLLLFTLVYLKKSDDQLLARVEESIRAAINQPEKTEENPHPDNPENTEQT